MAPIQTDPAHSLPTEAGSPTCEYIFPGPSAPAYGDRQVPNLTLPILTSDALGASLPAL